MAATAAAPPSAPMSAPEPPAPSTSSSTSSGALVTSTTAAGTVVADPSLEDGGTFCSFLFAPKSKKQPSTRALSSSGPESVLKRGFLVKQGHVVKNWKRRYFVLTTEELRYYEKESDSTPRGTIPLRDITKLRPKGRGTFQIYTTSKDFVLVASSEAAKKEWMKTIHKAQFRPSRLAQLLREAAVLEKSGRITKEVKDAIKNCLVSGDPRKIAEAERRIAECDANPAGASRASDEIESMLVQFENMSREVGLVNVLTRLAKALQKQSIPQATADKIRDLAAIHHAQPDDRWTSAVQQKYTQLIACMRVDSTSSHAKVAPDSQQQPQQQQQQSKHTRGGAAPSAAIAIAGASVGTADAAAGAAHGTPASYSTSVAASSVAASSYGATTAAPAASVGASGASVSVGAATPAVHFADPSAAAAGAGGGAGGMAGAGAGAGTSTASGAGAGGGTAQTAPAAAGAHGQSKGATSYIVGSDTSLNLDAEYIDHTTDESPAMRSKFDDDYVLGAKIGEGGYSLVYEGVHRRTRELVAVKCVEKSRLTKMEEKGLIEEVRVMRKLNHPNIVRLIAFYDEPRMFYIVTELMTGGELFDQIVKKTHYSEQEAQGIVRTLAKAIAYCHDKGIVHRDLKPENILLSSLDERTAVIKIADMGFARTVRANGMETSCGTPSYVAPEVLRGERYGAAVDLWSLGVVMYILLCGYAPFAASTQTKLFKAICRGVYRFGSPYWDAISEQAKDLISHLLVLDTSHRYTARQVLSHPWIASAAPASNVMLSGVLKQMRKYNQRRRQVIKRGFLVKQGHFIKNWKRRSFVLTGDELLYYESETSTQPLGIIPLAEIADVVDVPNSNSFKILTAGGKFYTIKAASSDEKQEWMRAVTSTHQHSDLMSKAQVALRAQEMEEAISLLSLADEFAKLRDDGGGDAGLSQSYDSGSAAAVARRAAAAASAASKRRSGSASQLTKVKEEAS